jgi:hypothetical protein
MSDYIDESEKTFRWLGVGALVALTVIGTAMTSCEQQATEKRVEAMSSCVSMGGSWVAGGNGFQCLLLGPRSDAPGVTPLPEDW